MILALKLLLAHLLADFGLQSYSWVQDKEKKRFKSTYLYWHVLLHGLLTGLFLIPEMKDDVSYVWILPAIVITHWLIDGLKLELQFRYINEHGEEEARTYKQWLFVLDQLLHITVLSVLWYVYELQDFEAIVNQFGAEELLLMTSIFFLTTPSSIIIKVLISGWIPELNSENKSLENAGKYIGILERLFIFGFLVSGNWSGIGFLLAAKSVFRFGDLKEDSEIKLTEYILIGTLLSFGFAVLTGMIYVQLSENFL